MVLIRVIRDICKSILNLLLLTNLATKDMSGLLKIKKNKAYVEPFFIKHELNIKITQQKMIKNKDAKNI